MKNNVYVLLVNNKINGAIEENDVMVFADLEQAKKQFEKLKKIMLKEIGNEIDNFVIEEDADELDFLPTFCIYEDGYFNENYYMLTIYQREIV